MRTNFHYNGELRHKPEEWRASIFLHPFLKRVEPLPPSFLLRSALGKQNGFYESFHDEGWIEADLLPRNDSLWDKKYNMLFDTLDVSVSMQDTVLQFVRKWASAGITVFGTAPPAGPRIFAIEQQKAGWDIGKFATAFEAAGGTWLDAGKPGDYSYFDGLHFDAAGGARMSEYLGKQMNQGNMLFTSPSQ